MSDAALQAANAAANQAANPAALQQKAQQFLQMLPLTLAIAGLSHAEPGKYFNEDQMDIRVRTLKAAYKHARKLVREAAQE